MKTVFETLHLFVSVFAFVMPVAFFSIVSVDIMLGILWVGMVGSLVLLRKSSKYLRRELDRPVSGVRPGRVIGHAFVIFSHWVTMVLIFVRLFILF